MKKIMLVKKARRIPMILTKLRRICSKLKSKLPEKNVSRNPKTIGDSKKKTAKWTKCKPYLWKRIKARSIRFNSRQMRTYRKNTK